MPTARTVSGDAVGLPTGQGAAAFEPNPADLRDQHARPCPVVLADPQRLRPDDPQVPRAGRPCATSGDGGSRRRTCATPGRGRARPAAGRSATRGKPRLRSSGFGQLRGLRVVARRRAPPTAPHQALLQAEVPHVPGLAALLQQEHFLRGARVQAEPHGTQRSVGLRHPGGNQTPIFGVVAASSTTCTSTWCSSPGTGVACSTRRCSTGASRSWRRCARTSAPTCAEFNGEEDHVHLLVHYPPKVALSHLVNSLKGVSSRRLRQDFVGRINRAAMRGRFWSPSYFAGSCGGAPLRIVKDYIARPETTRPAGFLPALKDQGFRPRFPMRERQSLPRRGQRTRSDPYGQLHLQRRHQVHRAPDETHLHPARQRSREWHGFGSGPTVRSSGSDCEDHWPDPVVHPVKTGLSLPTSQLALVTGATGYIGGRLVPELLAAGFRVRVMARQPRNLADREWHDQVEIVQGDAADPDSLTEALAGWTSPTTSSTPWEPARSSSPSTARTR